MALPTVVATVVVMAGLAVHAAESVVVALVHLLPAVLLVVVTPDAVLLQSA